MNIAQFIIDIAAQGDAKTLSKIEAIQGRLDKADQSAGRLKRSLGQAFSSLPGAEFFLNPIVALTTGIGVVSKIGMEAEKTATSFNVLVGSEDKAAKMLGEMNKYASTIWDRATIQQATKMMLAYEVSAETVVDDLKMLGDVAMGDKNRLQQLAMAYGQVSSAGRLRGQELMQMINAGYNPLLDLSTMTGKSIAQLQDEVSKGAVTFDMVRAAFQQATGEGGKFNNMTERLAQTSYGAFNQLRGKLLGTLEDLYKVIQPLVIPVLNALGAVLEKIGSFANWAADNIDTLAPIIKVLTAAIGGYIVATNLANIVTGAFVAIIKVLTAVMNMSIFGLVVAGIAALVAIITICWNKFAGFRAVVLTVWDTLKGFGQMLKTFVVDRITGLIAGIGKLGLAISKLFKGDFAGAWETAKAGASQFMGIDAARNAAASARSLAGGIRDNYGYHLEDERAKQAAKAAIEDPKAAAGAAGALPVANGAAAAATPTSTANAITTGGTRNTSIVLNIGKFFDDVVIHNTNNTSLGELRDAVLESVNRSLEIAISAAR